MPNTLLRAEKNASKRTESLPLTAREPKKKVLPSAHADQVGSLYASTVTPEYRKTSGLYFTSPRVAQFMASLIHVTGRKIRILDPAAGAGILLCSAVEQLAAQKKGPKYIELHAYEIDPALCKDLEKVLRHLRSWAAAKGISVSCKIECRDFILANSDCLESGTDNLFDVVIANPPYFKIGRNDPRAIATESVVYGQPNIYGLFMAVAASMLRPEGQFVFITPRSFCSGPYFQRFRQRLFQMLRPVQTHIFASRKKAFSHAEILQENIILLAVRQDDWHSRTHNHAFTISTSEGPADIAEAIKWIGDLNDVLNKNDPYLVLRLPGCPEDEAILHTVDSWTGSLKKYGLEISTGPVVPFRATQWLAHASNGKTVPLIWMNHVRPMKIHWPNGVKKPQHIISKKDSHRVLVATQNYVLIRRFSAKEEQRRLTAAPLIATEIDSAMIGLENHLNYIHRPHGIMTENETYGLAALYNSSLFDRYFRCINGNTQVSATELRAIPLPPLEKIKAIGSKIRKLHDPFDRIDHLVLDALPGLANFISATKVSPLE